MIKQRTDKDTLTPEDIVNYIKAYEKDVVPDLNKYWNYYLGKNVKILEKPVVDANNPDNRTPVGYGRKIITTFTGYAYRPRYITYKSDNDTYLKELQVTFDENNEHIKTSIHGRNTGIFGLSYELMYIGESQKTGKPEIKFAVIDPREMILLYNYELEPKKKIAIRYYPIDEKNWKVFVYYDDRTEEYSITRERYTDFEATKLTRVGSEGNYFEQLPIIAFYLGQDIQGIIEPVIDLIDDYDLLVSDYMNEVNRFSNAYLRLVGMSLDQQDKGSSPGIGGIFQPILNRIKRLRTFEQLKNKDDVSFLTKDIPTEYTKFMAELVRDQIHIQSHVPDLGSGAFADGVTGVAIQRLMFDFENVVSNAEAEFDTALYDRIKLITKIYDKTSRANGAFDEITISHKRNAPLNLKEFAEISNTMSQAGFSRYAIVDIWPDDIFPDVEEELKRQDEDREAEMPDVEEIAGNGEPIPEESKDATEKREEKRR